MKRRNPKSAFWKELTPKPKLAAVVGNSPMTRTDMISKLWKYIKKNKLQSKSNPRMIKADASLKELFGGKAMVSMFEMTKLAHRQLA
ncbi:MAG TPA: SWIB/MDM2 domain-containing protein [Verrucomicrobiae bacterium]|nr:SWIB/MDM2 domain-containing protein [Verrucomicrobiae bacterium]